MNVDYVLGYFEHFRAECQKIEPFSAQTSHHPDRCLMLATKNLRTRQHVIGATTSHNNFI
jgi:hypothetical protein